MSNLTWNFLSKLSGIIDAVYCIFYEWNVCSKKKFIHKNFRCCYWYFCYSFYAAYVKRRSFSVVNEKKVKFWISFPKKISFTVGLSLTDINTYRYICVCICAVQILKGIVCIDNVDSNNINNKKNHKNRIRKRSTTGNDSVKKWMENILKKNLLRIVHSQYGVNDFLLHCINQLLKWTHTCVHFQLLQFNSI